MKHFKTRFGSAGLVALISLLFIAFAPAASAAGDDGEEVNLAGCLKEGAGDTFSLKAEDGKTYTLKSSSVDLSAHKGHTVKVTGKVAADFKREGSGSVKREFIEVSAIQHVSADCQ